MPSKKKSAVVGMPKPRTSLILCGFQCYGQRALLSYFTRRCRRSSINQFEIDDAARWSICTLLQAEGQS